jgi:hypothetical protein
MILFLVGEVHLYPHDGQRNQNLNNYQRENLKICNKSTQFNNSR